MRGLYGWRRPFVWLITLSAASLGLANREDVGSYLKEHVLHEAGPKHGQSDVRYMPDFSEFARNIVGRQDDQVQSLSNNAPEKSNLEAGETQYWTFPKSALQRSKSRKPKGLPSTFQECPGAAGDVEEAERELRKRQSEPDLYITLNTCDQPSPKQQGSKKPPGQLQLFISTDSANSKPGPNKHDHVISVIGGYGALKLTVNKDVFIAVVAPTDKAFSGIYNYELTGSIDDHFAKVNASSASKYVDSDKTSALIYSSNTTSCNSSHDIFQAWRNNPPPYQVFVSKQDDISFLGLQNSMCGLQKHAQISDMTNVKSSITLAGGGQPKQQFYISDLDASTSYYAVLALQGTDGNSSSAGGGKVNGGGTIWAATNFTTKSSPNCAVIYDLDFCSEVAYAVPSNSTDADNMADLRAAYDSYASNAYGNFTKSLQQIPCNTTDTAQYSLAVTCDDCAAAYKNWLCAVTVPRCEDFSNNASYLLPRATGLDFIDEGYGRQFSDDPIMSQKNRNIPYFNSSRSPLIDDEIKPGPYKELLPCEDLCYNLVRSCPAVLGFACPLEGHGLNHSYAKLRPVDEDTWTCNFPGTDLNGSSQQRASFALVCLVAAAVVLWNLVPS